MAGHEKTKNEAVNSSSNNGNGLTHGNGETNGNGSRKKTTLTVLIVFAAISLIGGIYWWHLLRTTIKTDNAKVTGDIVDVSAKVSGRLITVAVKEGQHVEKGTVLAALDQEAYTIAVKQAEASLALAQANLAKLPDDRKSAQAAVSRAQNVVNEALAKARSAEASIIDARRNAGQTETLYKSGAASQETYDLAQSKLQSAQAAYDAAAANAAAAAASLAEADAKLSALNNTAQAIYEAQVKQAQAALENTNLTLKNTTVVAPISGTVIRIACQTGENVSAGQSIVTLTNLESAWVTANIEESKVGRIQVSQPVDIKVDAYPDRVFKGKVDEISSASQSTFALIPTESTSGNFTKVAQRFPVKIRVTDEGTLLKPGMSVVLTIHTK